LAKTRKNESPAVSISSPSFAHQGVMALDQLDGLAISQFLFELG
jgi:hypothetical protein